MPPFPPLQLPSKGTRTAVPFLLSCPCGAKLKGVRLVKSQIIRCPGCGSERFVLPLSPLPDPLAPASSSQSPRRWSWLVISITALGAAALLLVAAIIAPRPNRDDLPIAALPSEDQLRAHIIAGRQALAEGAPARAAAELETAFVLHERLGRPTDREHRQWQQLHRQAALLADLLPDSLSEILRHSIGMPEAEWELVVRRRYVGRAFILDDLVERTPDGRVTHTLDIPAPGGHATIDLNRLTLLHDLPLQVPQRLLLGMRIAELRRSSDGWSIVPETTSGVLLTDPDVFAALSLPADAELREVLKRQREWVDRP